jgi:hypothetical protein
MLLARLAALETEVVEACEEEQEVGVVAVVVEVAEVTVMALSKQTGPATAAIWSVSHCTFFYYHLRHCDSLHTTLWSLQHHLYLRYSKYCSTHCVL